MISEEILDLLTERVVSRIQSGNTAILKRIGSKIDEIGTLNSTEAQQLIQTLKYGGDYKEIVKELSKITNLSTKDIEDIFKEVSKKNYKFAEQFYKYRNIPYTPFEENVALQSQLQAITNITNRKIKEMLNPRVLGFGMIDTRTGEVEYKGIQKAYYDLLDEAVMTVGQGKETFDQAMSRQIKAMGGGGLKVIYDSTYINKEGVEVHHTRRLDSAIRMNLKDGLRQLHNENQILFGQQFGSDGVEISVHENPAPDHELVQGRQFSNEEYEKLQSNGIAKTYDGIDIDLYLGNTFRPISEYNCYHTTFSIVLGISKPEYTNDQLQGIIDRNNEGFEIDGKKYTRYQGTQMQRRLETEIRKQKDIQIMAKESGQMELVRESQQKITQLTQKYRELSKKADIPTKMERMKVSGYKRINADKMKTQNIPKTFEQWQEHFREKYGTTSWIGPNDTEPRLFISKSLKNMDNELLNDNLQQIEYLYDKYGLNDKGLRILVDESNEHDIAFTRDRNIAYTGNMLQDKKTIIDRVKEGCDKNFYMKINKGNESKYTITHEIGHVVENKIIDKWNIVERSAIDNEIKDMLLSNVSKRTGLSYEEIKNKYFSNYSRSRKSFEWFAESFEWFAESFTQLELGDKNVWIEEFEKWLKTKY